MQASFKEQRPTSLSFWDIYIFDLIALKLMLSLVNLNMSLANIVEFSKLSSILLFRTIRRGICDINC